MEQQYQFLGPSSRKLGHRFCSQLDVTIGRRKIVTQRNGEKKKKNLNIGMITNLNSRTLGRIDGWLIVVSANFWVFVKVPGEQHASDEAV